MKLISLNVWGGELYDPLIHFIQENSAKTDIFCFQEVLRGGSGRTARGEVKNLFESISSILINHNGYFFEYGEGGYHSESSTSMDFKYGVVCFVRKSLKQSLSKGITLYDPERKWNDYSGGFAAGASLAVLVENCVVVNVHGLWQGSIKEDTEAKLEQSSKILELADAFNGKKIICGDFNLLPHTQSIQVFRNRYQDLIEKYKIQDTRGSLYTKPLRYSDYVFIDKDINPVGFGVPKIEVSDHLPLVIDFEW